MAFSLLWFRFDPWPGNFYMLWEWPKKRSIEITQNEQQSKKKKKKSRKISEECLRELGNINKRLLIIIVLIHVITVSEAKKKGKPEKIIV